MIKILQLSDLHIKSDSYENNFSRLLLRTTKEEFASLPRGKKLLIITGDFHLYNEIDYHKTFDFLKTLSDTMGIDRKEDLFIIPGNHDVNPSEEKREKINQDNLVKAVKSDISLLQEDTYIDMLLERFNKYAAFCRSLGVYSDAEAPEAVHLRTWRDQLRILHINTCLVADGKEKDKQLLDTKTLTGLESNTKLPCIALGHNSFFDLHENVKRQTEAAFYGLDVRAYLCGDRHKIETDRYQQQIVLESGYGGRRSIPNIVCVRSSADVRDDFSDVGCFIHDWDESSGKVNLTRLIWNPQIDQSKFIHSLESDVYNLNTTSEFAISTDKIETLDDDVPKKTLIVVGKDGRERKAEILSAFSLKKTGKNYILYTLNEKYGLDEVVVYANELIEKDGVYSCAAIESDEEWKLVKQVMREIRDSK